MPYFNIVAETSENTVVAGYEPVKRKADSYQSEAELEKEFIRILGEQGYEYLPIHTEDDLIKNLRTKLEELNHYTFSDDEWDRFFKNSIANPNDHIVEKTRKIQEDYVQVLIRDDGSSKNITLIDKKQVHNNRLQVINQYEVKQEDGARHDNRYDVTVLVNGFPLVHIELKRRGVPIREAFNHTCRYSLYQTEQIRNTTQTVHDSMLLKMPILEIHAEKRQVIPLNLRHSGQMQTTILSLI